MITKEQWVENVVGAVNNVSDKNFQEKTWFGNSEGLFSTPNEVYWNLLDDFDFEDFLESEQIGLTKSQKKLGYELLQKMNAFYEKMKRNFTAEAILGSPDWNNVRTAASDFLNSMEGDICKT